jgi:hypothetical protein
MDLERFDRWTREMFGRRPALGMLAGGFLAAAAGLPSAVGAKKRKKRCRRSGQACSRRRKCCSGRKCTAGRCCDRNGVFVTCTNECLCDENPQFCCVGQAANPQKPQCESIESAPEFCCPPESVCGDFCCDLDNVCVAGQCVCRPENKCGENGEKCCPLHHPDCECIEEQGICSLDCPSGGGSFLRVRRVR